ncbi:hypothetical protein ESCO_005982 [Escovopsis weberi]|uniref:Uncharacterized protein n=1 Tax=Escovopsis weberi TaxID=150374 RepID=A0A0M9VRX3_ESCWE|nr:hypothetical protein ESCO_005982 [Escovopsis weberi]
MPPRRGRTPGSAFGGTGGCGGSGRPLTLDRDDNDDGDDEGSADDGNDNDGSDGGGSTLRGAEMASGAEMTFAVGGMTRTMIENDRERTTERD